MTVETIKLSNIRTDGGTQSRAEIHEPVVTDYAEAMKEGANFPPMVVFYDGKEYWLADGFHRHAAILSINVYRCEADVRQGSKRDAVLFSVGANAVHGLRRTILDKRRAVNALLADDEWAAWSDNKIAEKCRVSAPFVKGLRPTDSALKKRKFERNGTTYEQDTSNIGRRYAPIAATPPAPGYEDEKPRTYSPPSVPREGVQYTKPIKAIENTDQLNEGGYNEILICLLGDNLPADQVPLIAAAFHNVGLGDLARDLSAYGASQKPNNFEAFYSLYPNKQDRRGAEAAYKSAIRRPGISHERIMNGLVRYMKSKPDNIAWKMPATFLNKDSFDNEEMARPQQQTISTASQSFLEGRMKRKQDLIN